MSIAEFYLDHGIDPGDPHGMDNFLAATFGDFSDDDGFADDGAGRSAGGKRRRGDGAGLGLTMQEDDPLKLFVGGLPWALTSDDLREVCLGS
jgi:hypothetical protein